MSEKITFKELQIIYVKDIAYLTGASPRLSQRIYSDLKKDFNVKRVTYSHLRLYLGV